MHADVFWDLEIYMFLRRSLASLARAYKLHVHDLFFVGTFGGLAPQYQKAGYATDKKCRKKVDNITYIVHVQKRKML